MESRPPKPPVAPTFIWPQAMVAKYLEAKGLEMAAQFHRAERGQYAGTEMEYTLWDKDMRFNKENYPVLNPIEILQKVMRHSGCRAYGTRDAAQIFTVTAYPHMHNKDFQPPPNWRPNGNLPNEVVQKLAEYERQQEQYRQDLQQWRKDFKAYQEQQKEQTTTSTAATATTTTPTTTSAVADENVVMEDAMAGVEMTGVFRPPTPSSPLLREADVFLANLEKELLER